jgi:uncharacterized protein
MEDSSKYLNLLSYIKQYSSAVVAFSGGGDSTLLCRAAFDVMGKRSLAITVVTPLIPQREIVLARESAANIGIPHKIIEIPELDDQVQANPSDRCYHCKKIIFNRILSEARTSGIGTVFDGSNLDDQNDYRPGIRALKELKVLSPLKEAGLSKQDIRYISKQLNLPTWNLPAYACLASRIPYESPITSEKLYMVEQGEDYLQELGFKQVRLRHHGDIARIELAPEEMKNFIRPELMSLVSKRLKDLGFTYVCLELEGYRMGSLNEKISDKKDNG